MSKDTYRVILLGGPKHGRTLSLVTIPPFYLLELYTPGSFTYPIVYRRENMADPCPDELGFSGDSIFIYTYAGIGTTSEVQYQKSFEAVEKEDDN